MQLKKVREELNKFGKFVVQQARTRLTKGTKKGTKNVSKKLYNSLDYLPYVKGEVIGVKFIMEDYGKFVDQGVKGLNPNRLPKGSRRYGQQQAPNSPFSFSGGKGGGLRKGIKEWVMSKGLKGRDKKGRFITRKSLRFLITRSIYLSGIKPSMFFTKPFQQAYKKLPKELQEKFVTDLENIIFE
tara:strand:+ start:564 stop:1115 length:552 start_codon:yes stop_codon:yes gene_type:complete